MIPKHSRRKVNLAPNQIFSVGFRDGLAQRPHHPQFQNHPDYLKGYAAGSHSDQDHPLRSPAPPRLISFFRRSTLDSALLALQSWEDDRLRLGFGTVALSFHQGWAGGLCWCLKACTMSFCLSSSC